MGKLRKGSMRYLFCFAVGILVGILIGVIAFNIFISYEIDKYHKKIAQMEIEIQDKNTRLEKLEKATIDTKKYILKDMEISLIFDADNQGKNKIIDELDEIEMKKHIKEKYLLLLGKKVEDIDADMVSEIIDKRIFKLKEKEYHLNVKKLIITETLKIWIEVVEQ